MTGPHRWAPAVRWLIVIVVGLVAVSPFLSPRMVNSGDGMNYSMSVADAVTQVRAGVFPPLVGQSVYAFNGRVHPLRTAPYLHYVAIGLDTVTGHTLGFGALQNLSLAFSLMVAVGGCFWGLRWGLDCDPDTAVLLSAVYILSPAVLSTAYSFDLFMTVHVVSFVPIALAGCLRACRRPGFAGDAVMAAGLAAAWLAHPPVGFWLSLAVFVIRGLNLLTCFSWASFRWAAAGAILFLGLACFGLESASSFPTGPAYFGSSRLPWDNLTKDILRTVNQAFPDSILPVDRRPTAVSDSQLGYTGWALAALLLTSVAFMGTIKSRPPRADRMAEIALAFLVTTLLVLTIPVPWVTPFLWRHVPPPLLGVTAEWPMYRTYLVATGLLVFGGPLALRRLPVSRWLPGRWPQVLLLAGLAWSGFQAERYLSMGFANRFNAFLTRVVHLPTNVDLGARGYQYLAGGQQPYGPGVVDPLLEFRLVRPETGEAISLMAEAERTSDPIDRLTLQATADGRGAESEGDRRFILQPGRRYLLVFDFQVAPLAGATVEISGPTVLRDYPLDIDADNPGFSMQPGHRRSLAVWTDSKAPEMIALTVTRNLHTHLVPKAVFATVQLRAINPDRLPVRATSLIPLKFDVDVVGPGWTVETPRRYIAGYVARVNGQTAEPILAQDRQVAVRLPAGHSRVILSYAGLPLLWVAFWISCASWLFFFSWLFGLWRRPGLVRLQAAAGQAAVRWISRPNRPVALWSLGFAVALGVAITGMTRAERARLAPGPLAMQVRFPYGRTGRYEPLYSSGREGAATVLGVHYLDSSHVELQADVWFLGLFKSGPLPCDFAQIQTIVVSETARYPLDDPRIRALPVTLQSELRGRLVVTFNGRTVILARTKGYDSQPKDIHVGRADFGSNTEAHFQGQVLDHFILPVPQVLTQPGATGLSLDVEFPEDRVGQAEPLATIRSGGTDLAVVVRYLPDHRLQVIVRDAAGEELERTDPLTVAKGPHRLDLGATRTAAGDLRACCRLDREIVLHAESPLRSPVEFITGIDLTSGPGVNPFFSGRQLSAEPLRMWAAIDPR